MALTLQYNSTAPGVTAERMRSDYEAIWKQNIVQVTVTRATDSQAGDYFHEGDDPGETSTQMWMNIQGTSSGDYSREKPGVSTTGSQYHAYVRHFEDVRNLDVVIWNGDKFIIKNRNDGINNGVTVFIEFDLAKVDKT